MAEERDEKREGRRDETSELTLGELEFDSPTADLDLEEIVESDPPPVPTMTFGTPGLGRPRKTQPRQDVSTLKAMVAPVVGDSKRPPPPKGEPSRGESAAPKGTDAASVPPPAPSAPGTAKAPSLPPPTPSSPGTAKAPSLPPPTPSSPGTTEAPSPEPSASATPKAPPAAPPPPEAPPADDSSDALRTLLERELRQKPDAERAARLGYELGRLYEIELDDLGKAAEHYQATLRHAPDHAAALHGARRTLGALGRHAALPALFDAEVKITRDPAARARLLYAKARVMEEHLRQAGPALKVYREALALDPGNLSILKAIERALRRDKAWGDLASVYGQLANAVEDPSLRAAWIGLRARLTETELKDPVQAAALYESALEADPHATSALASVKRLSVSQKRWPELVRALRREHDLTRDGEARLSILTTIATVQERRLGDAEAAIATLEQAAALRPNERSLLHELARLHRAAGRHAQEAEALARLVDQTEGTDPRATLCHRIGRLHEQELGSTDRARAWYERALGEDPSHRASALALVAIHEARGDWEAVIRVHRTRAEAMTAPAERAQIFHHLGVLAELRLGDLAQAAEHHARALGLDPDHGPAFDALTRLHAQAGRWDELAELYQRAIDRAPNGPVAIAWLFRLGAILEDRLDDPDGAVVVYDRILEREPKNVGALHAVARAAERAQRWERLQEALLAEAERSGDKARAHALRHRAAEVTADGLGDPAAAARALEAILQEDPKHRPSLETLATLYSTAGKWEELVAVYRRMLPLLPSAAEKVRLWMRIGEIQEVQLGNDVAAIEAQREALRLDPELEPAREALLRSLDRGGAPTDFASALEEQLGRASSPRERARLATELGALQEEKLGKRDLALASYERALEALPLHRPALDARERLLIGASDWKTLVSVLSAEAEGSDDPFLSTHAALRAAMVLAEQQGAVAPALEAFRPVFDAQPEHLGALLAVEEIYARTRDDEGLAATYARMSEIVRDPKAQLAALQELARARASAGGDTTDVHRRILRLAPDDASALEALATDALKNGDHDSLLAMHARLAATSDDPTASAFHQTRVGEILLGDGDAGGALAAFRAAIALDPRSAAAARGLTRAARQAGDPAALRQAARGEEEVTRDLQVAVGVLLEAAKIRREQGDLAGAAEDCQRALALDPDNEAAAAGLRAARRTAEEVPQLVEHLSRAALAAKDKGRACELHLTVAQLQADARGDLPAAVAATQRALAARPEDAAALSRMAAYLERNGQWREAANALEKLIGKAQGEPLALAHLRLAGIAEQHLDDPTTAVKSLRAVLKRDPDRPEAIAPLIRLERNAGRDEEALRLAKKLIEVATDEDQRTEALSELAQLELARGEAAAAAAAAFSAVGMRGPKSPAARVYRDLVLSAPTHANWDSYATALMTFLDKKKPSPDEVSTTYRELARIFSEAHNRPDRAIATLREGVEACPDDPDIALALVDALAQLEAHDKAAAELQRLLRRDVRIARAWRSMADRMRALGEVDGAAIALTPLVALGEATDEEQRRVRARSPRAAEAPPGILGEAGIKQIIDDATLESSAAGLTVALAEVIAKLEGVDYEKHGVVKRDRIRAGEPHAVRALVDRIAVIFGAPELDLFMVERDLKHAVIEPGSTPALLVPSSLEKARDPVLAFELARPIALHARQLHAVDRIPPETLARILIGAARQYEPDFTLGYSGAELEADTRRVAKALPWLQRGRIQDAATTFAAQPPDVAQWIQAVHRMAYRAALLVSDDLLAALEVLGEPLDGPIARDLALFWVADPALRFRRAVAQQL